MSLFIPQFREGRIKFFNEITTWNAKIFTGRGKLNIYLALNQRGKDETWWCEDWTHISTSPTTMGMLAMSFLILQSYERRIKVFYEITVWNAKILTGGKANKHISLSQGGNGELMVKKDKRESRPLISTSPTTMGVLAIKYLYWIGDNLYTCHLRIQRAVSDSV